jgi:hypothetical protein
VATGSPLRQAVTHVALTAFEAEVPAGKANRRVVQPEGSHGGGGARGAGGQCILLLCIALRRLPV